MKKITLLFGLLLASQSWAQDCGALSFYTENFEGVTVPAIPTCASTSASGGSNNWATSNNPGNGFESNTLQFTGNASAADAWYFTRGIALTAGTYYKISYRYGNNSTTNTENVTVTFGTMGNNTDPQFQTHTITGGAPATNTIDFFPAPATGTYYFGFHATSAAGMGNIYLDDIIIEPATCTTPANIKATNVLSTSATLSWDANNANTFSVYHYAYMTTNTPPASPPDLQFSTATSVAATDLAPSTTYYLFVRSQCGPVNGDWSEPVIFTTPSCNAASLPYTQDFESATVPGLPSCTSQSPVETGNLWVTANNPGSGFANNTLHYANSDETANAWFFTQGIALTPGSYKVSYKYGNDSATTTETLKLIMASSPNPASQHTVLAEQTITGGVPATYANANALTVGEAGIYYFGLNAHSAAEQGSLYVDDITIEAWTCSEPANIAASNITTTAATITWEAVGNPAIGYLYSINTTNEPSTETFASGVTTDLTDLEPGTTYYFFIKGICGPVMGEWSDSISFTTPACEATTVPYILDFESATVPAVPACTIAHEATSGNDWVTGTNPGSGFDSKALVYTATNDAANSWFYTQGVEITAGTFYKISYKYGNNSATTAENLKVTLNSNPNPNYQIGDNFATHAEITGGTPATNSVEYFNLATSGVYYFGFNAYSDAEQGSIFVDDFKIEVMDCGEPVNGQATDITDVTATITWEAATSGNATPSVYQFAYGTSDTLPTEAGESLPGTTKALEGLSPDTQYYAFVRVQCGPTFSEWITIPFETDATSGLSNNTFKGLTVYPNPVKSVLNLDAVSLIESIEVYSLTGQLVLKQTVNNQNAAVNLQQLSTGAYLVNVIGEGVSKRIKIIKE